ncbi:MAG TPA: DNA gyrase inhibitor YacG [Acidobacteriaceae bacterium]|nr:DNA gyrase inhibitor YacG [Acidobacteriaceae bacterium]
MSEAKQKILRCPICRTIVPIDDPNVPFCSDRCRVIDLGKWASGAYRISSPILDPEVLEDIDEAALRRHQQEQENDADER